MSIEIRSSHNNKSNEIYVGNLSLLFSHETLVGIAIPGVGRIKRVNVWGSTTGKHLNAWPARYVVDSETFHRIQSEVDRTIDGYGTRDGLIKRVTRILGKVA